jgi:predicted Zn-dependent protease
MLRVDAGRSGSPRLVAVDRGNRRWEIVLRSSDVSRAQATLDIVDARLATAAGPPVLSLALSRALTLMTLAAALIVAQFLVVLLGLIAVLLPAPAVTAAVGAASVGTAMLIWRDQPDWMTETQRWTSVALMLCGLGMIAISIANRREKASQPALVTVFTGLLAGSTGIAWGAIAFYGIDPIDLHYTALEWPSAAVLPLAFAAALAFARWRPVRYASVLFAIAGFATVALGSTAFLHQFGADASKPTVSEVETDDLIPRPADTVLSEGWVPKEIPHADLYFVAIGDVPVSLMSDMASHFKEKFSMRITVLPALSFDRVTFDPVRSQTVADELITAVRQRYVRLARDGRTRVIGVTPDDMYMLAMAKQWQFTFSLRSSDEHVAVVSYARMDPSSLGARPDPGRFTARLHKMVAKNIGIMYYGLPISQDPRSVLYGQIGGVDELDLMTEYFEPQ